MSILCYCYLVFSWYVFALRAQPFLDHWISSTNSSFAESVTLKIDLWIQKSVSHQLQSCFSHVPTVVCIVTRKWSLNNHLANGGKVNSQLWQIRHTLGLLVLIWRPRAGVIFKWYGYGFDEFFKNPQDPKCKVSGFAASKDGLGEELDPSPIVIWGRTLLYRLRVKVALPKYAQRIVQLIYS